MLRRVSAMVLVWAGLATCSSPRKLSYVDARSPASIQEAPKISPLRVRLKEQKSFARSCPSELREFLPALASERVFFSDCSSQLSSAYEQVKESLRMDERSDVEQLLSQKCRPNREGDDDVLNSLLEKDAIVSRRVQEDSSRSPEARAALAELHAQLLELRARNQPLERWMRVNGEWVLSEEQLEFFDQLLNQKNCTLSNQEIDETYRTFHGLEELAKLEAPGTSQRNQIEALLRGVYKVMDRKIQEFFRK